MQGYITISQASELTGKHPDTIRRLWKGADNKVEPKLKAKWTITDRAGAILVNRELLLETYPSIEALQPSDSDQSPDPAPLQSNPDTALVALTKQLEAKDKQIDQLQLLIAEKEANQTKLSDQFQQIIARLQLPAETPQTMPNAYEPETVVEVPNAEPMQAKKNPTKPYSTKRKAKKPTASKQQVKKVSNTKKTTAKKKTLNKPKTDKPAKTEITKKRWWSRG